MFRFLALAAVCAQLAVAAPAHADWTTSAAAQTRYSDNVGNAQASDDKVSDEALAARVSLFNVLPLGSPYLLSVGTDIGGQWFDHLNGLRNTTIDGGISLRRRWGLGAYAPWVRVGAAIGRTQYDFHYRDYTGYRATLSGGKRLSERFNVWLDYAFEHREARIGEVDVPGYSADVFGGNGHSLAASLEYTLIDRLWLSFSVSARRGDLVSSTRPEYSVYAASRAIAEDPAFGDEWYAYRLLGNSYNLRLGASYQIAEHHLLGINVLRVRSYAGSNYYSNSIPEITWDYRF